MPRTKYSEYSATPGDNTDIDGINIGEGMAPSDVNNSLRAFLSQTREFIDGSSGDTLTSAKIVATTATILSGVDVTGTATFNSAVVLSSSITGSALSLSGALTVGGAAILSSTLGVTGTASMGVIDATTLEVTNIKAKDGTASATIADSTGVMTVASAVLTTADINGGTVDNAAIGSGTPSTGAFTTLSSNSTTTLNGTTIPASKTLLVSTDIGTTVQAYDVDTAKYDAVTANFTGTLQNGGSNVVVDSDIGSTVLAYDSNLQGFVTAFTLPTTDGTSNQVLKTDGSGNIGFATLAGTGTVTSVDVSGGTTGLTTSGGPITASGTITLAGTLAVANGGTGITSFGTGVSTFLETPSSANLAAAVTDETGTGALVFANTPTLISPILGTPTSGTLTNCTADGTNAVGFKNIPQSGSAKTASYTLATGDVGKFIEVGASGSIEIPDATFSAGDVISIFNNTTGDATITCTITTAYIAGTDADAATATLATRGICTILFISGTVCVISGNVS